MCHYCGCRTIPLIIDYIAEHEVANALALELITAMDGGNLDGAGAIMNRLAEELRAHWQGEENGLFEAMGRSDEYADYITALVREHRELEDLLASADLGSQTDRQRLRAATAELIVHIRKEEDGLFPASLTALDGDDWDRAITAWQDAHPGSVLRLQGS